MIEETPAANRRFAWMVALSFAVLTAPRLLLHELWRDEAWLWLVARESHSLRELFVPLARSGQAYLFPVLCYLARQVWDAPQAMQWLHLVLATAAAFVFARWAPFPRYGRVLFLLGYFPFYEYAVISRHYVLGALLAWIACAAARRQRNAVFGAALGLLCQTTVYGYILAAAIGAGWLRHRFQLLRSARRGEVAPLPRLATAVGIGLAAIGGAAGLLQLRPLPGTSFAPEWRFHWDAALAADVLRMPWRAFVPLPLPGLHFWNTNLLDGWPRAQTAAGVLVLLGALALLRRRPVALAIFAIGAAGFLAFGYLKLVGVLRHQGHIWLLFAAALWLEAALPPGHGGRSGSTRRGDHAGDAGPSVRGRNDSTAAEWTTASWQRPVLLGLLLVHCAAGAFASWMDLRHPFSNGAAAAALIRAQGLERYPLFGHREPPAATVSLALGLPLYAPSRRVFATRPDYGPEQREMSEPEVRCAARDLAQREKSDIVLVINRALPPYGELEPAGATSGAIAATEDYHLYRLRLDRLAATAAEARCATSRPPAP